MLIKNVEELISPPVIDILGAPPVPPSPSKLICLLLPNDIDFSVDETWNPLELIFKSVTLILASAPLIIKLLSVNFINPSSSPSLNSPEPEKNAPLPVVSDKLEVPIFTVLFVELISTPSVSNSNLLAVILKSPFIRLIASVAFPTLK